MDLDQGTTLLAPLRGGEASLRSPGASPGTGAAYLPTALPTVGPYALPVPGLDTLPCPPKLESALEREGGGGGKGEWERETTLRRLSAVHARIFQDRQGRQAAPAPDTTHRRLSEQISQTRPDSGLGLSHFQSGKRGAGCEPGQVEAHNLIVQVSNRRHGVCHGKTGVGADAPGAAPDTAQRRLSIEPGQPVPNPGTNPGTGTAYPSTALPTLGPYALPVPATGKLEAQNQIVQASLSRARDRRQSAPARGRLAQGRS